MKFDWKKVVGTVAPALATALGGPLAGLATQAVSEAVLGKTNGSEDEIATALSAANPEILLKLKQADHEFKLKMKELDISEEKLAYDDTANARAREIAVKDKMPAVIAVLSLTMFSFFLGALFYIDIPEANKPLIFAMLGTLGTFTVSSVQYYVGTTKGSTTKNDIIASLKG